MVHRTYRGATIQMRVFDNKLSIWNEGGLPFGLSIEDLKSDHNSRPRNPIIANACFFAGYIDTWGRGTLKIINSCKEAGLPEPEIKEMNGGVEVTIFISEVPKSGLVDGLVDIVRELGSVNDLMASTPEMNNERLKLHFGRITEHLQNTFGISSEKVGKEFGKRNTNLESCFRTPCTLPGNYRRGGREDRRNIFPGNRKAYQKAERFWYYRKNRRPKRGVLAN